MLLPLSHSLSPAIPPITAFEKAGLKVQFNFERNPANPVVTAITLTATNFTPAPLSNFLFQAAVPKVSQHTVVAHSYCSHNIATAVIL